MDLEQAMQDYRDANEADFMARRDVRKAEIALAVALRHAGETQRTKSEAAFALRELVSPEQDTDFETFGLRLDDQPEQTQT